MQMLDLLPRVIASVNDSAEAITATLFLRQLPRESHDFSHDMLMSVRQFDHGRHVFLGNEHEMNSRQRMNIVKCKYILIFVHLAAGNFPSHYPAKNAVVRHIK
jgi:hypothetical protein